MDNTSPQRVWQQVKDIIGHAYLPELHRVPELLAVGGGSRGLMREDLLRALRAIVNGHWDVLASSIPDGFPGLSNRVAWNATLDPDNKLSSERVSFLYEALAAAGIAAQNQPDSPAAESSPPGKTKPKKRRSDLVTVAEIGVLWRQDPNLTLRALGEELDMDHSTVQRTLQRVADRRGMDLGKYVAQLKDVKPPPKTHGFKDSKTGDLDVWPKPPPASDEAD